MSSLHSSGDPRSLAYEGMSTNSYHFSFLSDSPDDRSYVLSPIRFFNYSYRRILLQSFRRFAFHSMFTRCQASLGSSLDSLLLYCQGLLDYALLRLVFFSYLLLLGVTSLHGISSFAYGGKALLRPWGICLTSGIVFSASSSSYSYYLPDVLCFSSRGSIYPHSRRPFTASQLTFLNRFQPVMQLSRPLQQAAFPVGAEYKDFFQRRFLGNFEELYNR